MESELRLRDSGASREHVHALDTLRKAKNLLALFALLAPAVHLGAWAAIQFGGVLQRPTPADVAPAAAARAALGGSETPAPDAARSASPGSAAPAARAEAWEHLLGAGLPLAEFIGRCALLLLMVTLLLAVLVCLGGRAAGVSDFLAALYVAIFVGVLFLPWDRIAPGEANAYGVFTTADQLVQRHEARLALAARGEQITLFGQNIGLSGEDWGVVLDGMRFAALPLLAVLLLLICAVRYGRGFRAAQASLVGGAGR